MHGGTGDKLIQLYTLIRTTVVENGADLIAIEAAIETGRHGGISKNQLNAAAMMAASASQVTLREYWPATIKKQTAGHGFANKQNMIEAVRDRFGVDTSDDNVADAVAILEMAKRGFPGIGETKSAARKLLKGVRKNG